MKLFKRKTQEEILTKLDAVVEGNTQFALDLYKILRLTPGNLFYSPYSISTALAMTYGGAQGNTEAQMAQTLHFLLEQKQLHLVFALLREKLEETGGGGQVQLKIANALWPRKGIEFRREYLALAKKDYGVRIKAVDYGEEDTARQTINAWVEEKTEGKINELIGPGVLGRLTRMVLVNAIYFKGDWATPFEPSLTVDTPFWVAPDEQVITPMMTQKHTFKVGAKDKLQVLELPYDGNALSMIVLLPTETDGLANLEESMTADTLAVWTRDLKETEVEVSLPKFEISFPVRLDEALQSMGMVEAFSGQADFSGMDGSTELSLGAVLHKAFVAVDEQGTEAAAATAVVMQLKSLSFSPEVFRADHPFVFMIRENSTGSILFIGRVVKPV